MVSSDLGGSTQARSDSMGNSRNAQDREAQRGFTLLETLLVIAIIVIMSAMAVISIYGTLPQQEATASMNSAEAVFRQGRDSAISQRRAYQLVAGAAPLATNQMQLSRIEIGGTLTALPIVTLPVPATFMLYNGIPDTPDGYGTCSNGLCFPGSGGVQQWLSDGTFVNGGTGAPLNATIFIAVPGNSPGDLKNIGTQRAFTVLGTTGRIRAYKWNGGSGACCWVLE
jgi:prepilin-type N-terminal cleavage/methylation domain-containing protein